MDTNPTELRSLAAKSACIQLLYDWTSCETSANDTWKKEKDYGTCPDHEWFLWQLNEMQLPGSPVIPNVVLDQIEYHMTNKILKQVTKWICYHHGKNFFHDVPASPLKQYLLKLIWKPNYKIDYAATAKNVLAGSNFNTMEKYRFACTYCFPEDVWNLRDMAPVAIGWCFEKEPFLVYWNKCLANQLHTIPVPANDSIDEVMFAKALKEYDLWQPVKYFFGKLNSGARLSQCNNVFWHKRGKYQKELLALLSDECEKISVYRANMEEIIWNYETLDDFEGIRQICTELKDKLSFKDFALIIKGLARWTMYYSTHEKFNALTPLLMEIWNDASDEDKRQLASTGLQSHFPLKSYEMIMDEGTYHFDDRHRYRNPLVFIRALAEAYEPRNFLKENFFWLVLWQPFASVVGLIDEFQFNAEDVEELKWYTRRRRSRRMDYACTAYLASGEFDEFSSFVSFCYSDDNAGRIAYQRYLLMDRLDEFSNALWRWRVDWRIAYEFVNNVFRETDDEFASSYTTLLMQYALKRKMHFLMERMHGEEANSIVECVETFVPHHDNLSRAKKTCIGSLFKYLHNGFYPIFNETLVEKLLIWCYGTETGVARFKKKINVSKIFVAQLDSCVEDDTFKATDSMEGFLHWYYPLESERKAFKLKMIYSYGEFEKIGTLLKERKYRRRMLNWFFENDAYKIKEFITKIYV
ncbi:uncharacterized protein LOC135837918 [Planococcus citri]|uniref:uncharacterized protein LOC135837918 n=1 Tax=Planococcus citri TaxID=170843 RepID=UPI0031F780A3